MKAPTSEQRQQFEAEAAAALVSEIWDGVSPINGASPDVVRAHHPGDALYLIRDTATGQVLILQADDPQIPGRQPMDAATATLRAADHVAEVRSRMVDARSAEVMRPWVELRARRAELLTEADHQINGALDRGEDPAPIRAYRQSLRDITTGLVDPAAVQWPLKPWE